MRVGVSPTLSSHRDSRVEGESEGEDGVRSMYSVRSTPYGLPKESNFHGHILCYIYILVYSVRSTMIRPI